MGKINYTLPLLINSTQRQLERLNVIINNSCRIIIGNQCLKWSSERMLNKCGLKNIWQMIIESGLNFIHKVKINKVPLTITDQYTNLNKDRQTDTRIYTKYTPKTNKMKNFLLYKITEIYNDLDFDKRDMNIKDFKISIKFTIKEMYNQRIIPKYNKEPDSA